MKHRGKIRLLKILAKLKPVFNSKGTITAGNAPGVNDGACALVLMGEEAAQQEGRDRWPGLWPCSGRCGSKRFPENTGTCY